MISQLVSPGAISQPQISDNSNAGPREPDTKARSDHHNQTGKLEDGMQRLAKIYGAPDLETAHEPGPSTGRDRRNAAKRPTPLAQRAHSNTSRHGNRDGSPRRVTRKDMEGAKRKGDTSDRGSPASQRNSHRKRATRSASSGGRNEEANEEKGQDISSLTAKLSRTTVELSSSGEETSPVKNVPGTSGSKPAWIIVDEATATPTKEQHCQAEGITLGEKSAVHRPAQQQPARRSAGGNDNNTAEAGTSRVQAEGNECGTMRSAPENMEMQRTLLQQIEKGEFGYPASKFSPEKLKSTVTRPVITWRTNKKQATERVDDNNNRIEHDTSTEEHQQRVKPKHTMEGVLRPGVGKTPSHPKGVKVVNQQSTTEKPKVARPLAVCFPQHLSHTPSDDEDGYDILSDSSGEDPNYSDQSLCPFSGYAVCQITNMMIHPDVRRLITWAVDVYRFPEYTSETRDTRGWNHPSRLLELSTDPSRHIGRAWGQQQQCVVLHIHHDAECAMDTLMNSRVPVVACSVEGFVIPKEVIEEFCQGLYDRNTCDKIAGEMKAICTRDMLFGKDGTNGAYMRTLTMANYEGYTVLIDVASFPRMLPKEVVEVLQSPAILKIWYNVVEESKLWKNLYNQVGGGYEFPVNSYCLTTTMMLRSGRDSRQRKLAQNRYAPVPGVAEAYRDPGLCRPLSKTARTSTGPWVTNKTEYCKTVRRAVANATLFEIVLGLANRFCTKKVNPADEKDLDMLLILGIHMIEGKPTVNIDSSKTVWQRMAINDEKLHRCLSDPDRFSLWEEQGLATVFIANKEDGSLEPYYPVKDVRPRTGEPSKAAMLQAEKAIDRRCLWTEGNKEAVAADRVDYKRWCPTEAQARMEPAHMRVRAKQAAEKGRQQLGRVVSMLHRTAIPRDHHIPSSQEFAESNPDEYRYKRMMLCISLHYNEVENRLFSYEGTVDDLIAGTDFTEKSMSELGKQWSENNETDVNNAARHLRFRQNGSMIEEIKIRYGAEAAAEVLVSPPLVDTARNRCSAQQWDRIAGVLSGILETRFAKLTAYFKAKERLKVEQQKQQSRGRKGTQRTESKASLTSQEGKTDAPTSSQDPVERAEAMVGEMRYLARDWLKKPEDEAEGREVVPRHLRPALVGMVLPAVTDSDPYNRRTGEANDDDGRSGARQRRASRETVFTTSSVPSLETVDPDTENFSDEDGYESVPPSDQGRVQPGMRAGGLGQWLHYLNDDVFYPRGLPMGLQAAPIAVRRVNPPEVGTNDSRQVQLHVQQSGADEGPRAPLSITIPGENSRGNHTASASENKTHDERDLTRTVRERPKEVDSTIECHNFAGPSEGRRGTKMEPAECQDMERERVATSADDIGRTMGPNRHRVPSTTGSDSVTSSCRIWVKGHSSASVSGGDEGRRADDVTDGPVEGLRETVETMGLKCRPCRVILEPITLAQRQPMRKTTPNQPRTRATSLPVRTTATEKSTMVSHMIRDKATGKFLRSARPEGPIRRSRKKDVSETPDVPRGKRPRAAGGLEQHSKPATPQQQQLGSTTTKETQQGTNASTQRLRARRGPLDDDGQPREPYENDPAIPPQDRDCDRALVTITTSVNGTQYRLNRGEFNEARANLIGGGVSDEVHMRTPPCTGLTNWTHVLMGDVSLPDGTRLDVHVYTRSINANDPVWAFIPMDEGVPLVGLIPGFDNVVAGIPIHGYSQLFPEVPLRLPTLTRLQSFRPPDQSSSEDVSPAMMDGEEPEMKTEGNQPMEGMTEDDGNERHVGGQSLVSIKMVREQTTAPVTQQAFDTALRHSLDRPALVENTQAEFKRIWERGNNTVPYKDIAEAISSVIGKRGNEAVEKGAALAANALREARIKKAREVEQRERQERLTTGEQIETHVTDRTPTSAFSPMDVDANPAMDERVIPQQPQMPTDDTMRAEIQRLRREVETLQRANAQLRLSQQGLVEQGKRECQQEMETFVKYELGKNRQIELEEELANERREKDEYKRLLRHHKVQIPEVRPWGEKEVENSMRTRRAVETQQVLSQKKAQQQQRINEMDQMLKDAGARIANVESATITRPTETTSQVETPPPPPNFNTVVRPTQAPMVETPVTESQVTITMVGMPRPTFGPLPPVCTARNFGTPQIRQRMIVSTMAGRLGTPMPGMPRLPGMMTTAPTGQHTQMDRLLGIQQGVRPAGWTDEVDNFLNNARVRMGLQPIIRSPYQMSGLQVRQPGQELSGMRQQQPAMVGRLEPRLQQQLNVPDARQQQPAMMGALDPGLQQQPNIPDARSQQQVEVTGIDKFAEQHQLTGVRPSDPRLRQRLTGMGGSDPALQHSVEKDGSETASRPRFSTRSAQQREQGNAQWDPQVSTTTTETMAAPTNIGSGKKRRGQTSAVTPDGAASRKYSAMEESDDGKTSELIDLTSEEDVSASIHEFRIPKLSRHSTTSAESMGQGTAQEERGRSTTRKPALNRAMTVEGELAVMRRDASTSNDRGRNERLSGTSVRTFPSRGAASTSSTRRTPASGDAQSDEDTTKPKAKYRYVASTRVCKVCKVSGHSAHFCYRRHYEACAELRELAAAQCRVADGYSVIEDNREPGDEGSQQESTPPAEVVRQEQVAWDAIAREQMERHYRGGDVQQPNDEEETQPRDPEGPEAGEFVEWVMSHNWDRPADTDRTVEPQMNDIPGDEDELRRPEESFRELRLDLRDDEIERRMVTMVAERRVRVATEMRQLGLVQTPVGWRARVPFEFGGIDFPIEMRQQSLRQSHFLYFRMWRMPEAPMEHMPAIGVDVRAKRAVEDVFGHPQSNGITLVTMLVALLDNEGQLLEEYITWCVRTGRTADAMEWHHIVVCYVATVQLIVARRYARGRDGAQRLHPLVVFHLNTLPEEEHDDVEGVTRELVRRVCRMIAVAPGCAQRCIQYMHDVAGYTIRELGRMSVEQSAGQSEAIVHFRALPQTMMNVYREEILEAAREAYRDARGSSCGQSWIERRLAGEEARHIVRSRMETSQTARVEDAVYLREEVNGEALDAFLNEYPPNDQGAMGDRPFWFIRPYWLRLAFNEARGHPDDRRRRMRHRISNAHPSTWRPTPLEMEPGADDLLPLVVDDPRGNEPDGTLQWPLMAEMAANQQAAGPEAEAEQQVGPPNAGAGAAREPQIELPNFEPSGSGPSRAGPSRTVIMQSGSSGAGPSGARSSGNGPPRIRSESVGALIAPIRIYNRDRPSAHSRLRDNRERPGDRREESSDEDDVRGSRRGDAKRRPQ